MRGDYKVFMTDEMLIVSDGETRGVAIVVDGDGAYRIIGNLEGEGNSVQGAIEHGLISKENAQNFWNVAFPKGDKTRPVAFERINPPLDVRAVIRASREYQSWWGHMTDGPYEFGYINGKGVEIWKKHGLSGDYKFPILDEEGQDFTDAMEKALDKLEHTKDQPIREFHPRVPPRSGGWGRAGK